MIFYCDENNFFFLVSEIKKIELVFLFHFIMFLLNF